MSDTSTTDQQLQSAKLQIQLGQVETAISTLRSLLEDQPLDRDGLYYLAVCQRKTKDEGATQTIDVLKSAHPLYGRAYQEEGHLFKAEKNAIAAGQAYELAVKHNPALLSSWKVLVSYRKSTGQHSAAKEAMTQVTKLSSLPAELLTATSLMYENKLYMAEQVCRYFLLANEEHTVALRLLAQITTKLNMLDESDALLKECLKLDPEYSEARFEHTQVLQQQLHLDQAHQQATLLNQKSPDNSAYELLLARQTWARGELEPALQIYDQIIARNDCSHNAYLERGDALISNNQADRAVHSYQQAIASRFDYGKAYLRLAKVDGYRFDDLEIKEMSELAKDHGVAEENRAALCFALGSLLEERGEFSESFNFYELGNEIECSQSHSQTEQTECEFAKHKNTFTSDFFLERSDFGHDDATPIFIVGMPRSGGNQLAKSLAAHSQIKGNNQLFNIIGLAHTLNGRKKTHMQIRYPEILEELNATQLTEFAERYIDGTQHLHQEGFGFIDQMPHNFLHIALIHLILPNAKIIDIRRHPVACCFENFKRPFDKAIDLGHGLEQLGHYYQAYIGLMDHWHNVLPNKVLTVQSEKIDEDTQGQLEQILAFCDLPFEQPCLDAIQKSKNTPSNWRLYHGHLQPLLTAFGPKLLST